MCGRYALALRPSEVRQQLEQAHMPCDEAPPDDEARPTYNFAPGYHGLVYRAAVPDSEAGKQKEADDHRAPPAEHTRYRLQQMKWGLVPFWTKRKPDYGSTMKTINCRDDSLAENRGLWNTMKHRKRCIVVCQGFYEWLKKNGGKEKMPHFVKRKDGRLMCFAGLWDCVKFEGSDERLYTHTIITTDSNRQLKFLHDRMPVILENGSDELRTWLDPNLTEWNAELQSLLKPYEGELDCYPVVKDVGKVGNNSPTFIVPIDSKENKNSITNFFNIQKKAAQGSDGKKTVVKGEEDVDDKGGKIKHGEGEAGDGSDLTGTEDNAPLPSSAVGDQRGIKREHQDGDEWDDETGASPRQQTSKKNKADVSSAKATSTRKTRSATSNRTASAPKAAAGSKKITSFFGSDGVR